MLEDYTYNQGLKYAGFLHGATKHNSLKEKSREIVSCIVPYLSFVDEKAGFLSLEKILQQDHPPFLILHRKWPVHVPSESIEWFIEDQAFSPSYDFPPCTPPIKQVVSPVKLTDGQSWALRR